MPEQEIAESDENQVFFIDRHASVHGIANDRTGEPSKHTSERGADANGLWPPERGKNSFPTG